MIKTDIEINYICQCFQIKQFLKTCSVSNHTKKLRQLLEKIEENSKFIDQERAKVSFTLSEEKMLAAWESSIKTKGTPLLKFYENWSKVNKIQKRKKVSKNEEIASELPSIKRPKIPMFEEKVNKKEKQGPLVLFPSDSEDDTKEFKFDEENEEKPKEEKKIKKTKKKTKKVAKNKYVPEIDSTTDQADVVQDFSVSDW